MEKTKTTKRGSSQGKGKNNPYLVFISHATADKWIAKVFCEKIEAAGAETFRDDRDINGGKTYQRRSADKLPVPMRWSFS
jgi:hypothetical protein